MNDQRLGNGAWALGGRTFDAAIVKQMVHWFWHGGVMQSNDGETYIPEDCDTEECQSG